VTGVASPDLRPLLTREGLLDAAVLASRLPRTGVLDAAEAVDSKLVEEDQLADLLAREAGSVVIDLDQGTLEAEAVALISATLARKSLAIPVALEPGGAALQVAFANPLDTGNLAAIAASTGCTVRALVATVTAIRRALDREYGPEASPTQVLDTRRGSVPPAAHRDDDERAQDTGTDHGTASEESGRFATDPSRSADDGGTSRREASTEQPIPSESTRRLAEQGPVTLPLHLLESEASMEQRFEALLLALVERGAIARTDYADALRRLLKGR
jgi:hypothetical protein